MIFRRSYSLNSNLSKSEIQQKLSGKHFDVHNLDFEIMERDGILKVIPHTELADDDKVYTLPITHINMSESGSKTHIRLNFKPRRIDIGGPTIGLIFVLVFLAIGIALYMHDKESYKIESMVLMGLGSVLLVGFFYRMNKGYFDYIRKIKAWVKSKI